MKKVILIACIMSLLAHPVVAADGVITVTSNYNVEETADRLVNVLKEKGMTIFNRINHSEGAANVGLELRDTELVIFGNPKVGSPLMQCQQSVAIDLPQKALIWQDDNSQVMISYNEPKYLVKRHNIPGCEKVISKIEKALDGIVRSAAAK